MSGVCVFTKNLFEIVLYRKGIPFLLTMFVFFTKHKLRPYLPKLIINCMKVIIYKKYNELFNFL